MPARVLWSGRRPEPPVAHQGAEPAERRRLLAVRPEGDAVTRIDVREGDVLLYRGTGLSGFVIRIKTWSPVAHCELANSLGVALASRDGVGVRTFARMPDDRLYAVLRPRVPLHMAAVRAFHLRCLNQGYDWWGLLRFVTIGKQSMTKQFCSEYVMRLLRAGGCEPFTPETDADLVAPGQFLMSPALACVWRVGSVAGSTGSLGTVAAPAADAPVGPAEVSR